jgi:hypothetical protein
VKAFLSRLTAFDWVKVCLYGTSICGALSVVGLNTILKPWGFTDVEILALSAKIGSISAMFGLVGLIANTLKNPSPPRGTAPILGQSSAPIIVPATVPVADVPKVIPL